MCIRTLYFKLMCIFREPFKYYFADFVRKGGGGVPPKFVTSFSPKKKSVNGGAGGTPQIHNLFLDQNQVFFEQKKHNF